MGTSPLGTALLAATLAGSAGAQTTAANVSWTDSGCISVWGAKDVLSAEFRSAKAKKQNLNNTCVFVTISDARTKSVIPPVTYAGLIQTPHCDETHKSSRGGTLANQATLAMAAPSATRSSKRRVNADDNSPACKRDLDAVSNDIKSNALTFLSDFSLSHRGAKAVVTYTGTGNLTALQLGVTPR